MKNIFTSSIFTAFCILLFACSSTQQVSEKSLNKKPPFKILTSTYKTWVGGESGVKEIILSIETNATNIVLDSVYFKNMKAPLEKSQNSENNKYAGHFSIKTNQRDLILHSDSTKEFGNQVPNISKNIPFILNENEAVVSYNYKGKTNYFKLDNVTEDTEKLR